MRFGRRGRRVYDAPMLRTPRLVTACALAIAIAIAMPAVASAAPQSDAERPWGRGTMVPTFGFGLGLGRDATQLGFGLGFRYFAIGGLGLGLSLTDSITIFSDSLKTRYPGLTDRIPTNIFRITPSVQYVFFRSRWFSPYVHAGVGPSFFNNRRGVVGHWVAGPGAYIGIGGPVSLNLGVDFSSMFPSDKCNRAYRYQGAAGDVQFTGFCGFSWGPNIGIVVAFGGGRSKRRAPRSAPPGNPMIEAEPYDAAPRPEPPAADPQVSAPAAAEPVAPMEPDPMAPAPVDPGPVAPMPVEPAAPVDAPPPPAGPSAGADESSRPVSAPPPGA